MPSPFPGVDPYLEGPKWPDLHDRFIVYAAEYIQPHLPEQYWAGIRDRVVVAAGERSVIPDVTLVRRPMVRETAQRPYGSGVECDQPVVYLASLDDVKEPYLEIVDREADRVVTTVELLSPTNKTPGAGRDDYIRKQDELARAGANLVEIDLLQGGLRTVAPGLQLEGIERFYSLICVWRAAARHHEVYFAQLRNRLPCIRVPLLPKDGDVALDIQSVYSRCYDAARYELRLNYSQSPPIELSQEDAQWLDVWLREHGRRGESLAPLPTCGERAG